MNQWKIPMKGFIFLENKFLSVPYISEYDIETVTF